MNKSHLDAQSRIGDGTLRVREMKQSEKRVKGLKQYDKTLLALGEVWR
jgi:hypothetical protein